MHTTTPSSRQMAKSHVQPRTLAGYKEYLSKQVSCEGFLELKEFPLYASHLEFEWKRFYFVLTGEGEVHFFSSREDSSSEEKAEGSIPLEEIIRIKAQGDTLKLYSTDCVYFLKARDKDSLSEWFFALHRTFIGRLLEKLADSRYKVQGPLSSQKPYETQTTFGDEEFEQAGALERSTSGENKAQRRWSHSIDFDSNGLDFRIGSSSSSSGDSLAEGVHAPLQIKTVDKLDHTSIVSQIPTSARAPSPPDLIRRITPQIDKSRFVSTSPRQAYFDSSKRVVEAPVEYSKDIAASLFASKRGDVKDKDESTPTSNDENCRSYPSISKRSKTDEDKPLQTPAKDIKSVAKSSSGRKKYIPPHLRGPSIPTSVPESCEVKLTRNTRTHSDDDIFKMDSQQKPDSKLELYASCANKGHRKAMEDFHCNIRNLPSLTEKSKQLDLSFHAIYDGHCGIRVAELAATRLHILAAEHESMFSAWPTGTISAVESAIECLDSEFSEIANEATPPLPDGSCALIAIINQTPPRGVAIAYLGDSSAVLSRAGKGISLVKTHSPGRIDEKERIERAGGWVTSEKEILVERLHHMDLGDPDVKRRAKKFGYVEVFRVNGELAVSRALGDLDYKLPLVNSYPNWFFLPGHPGHTKLGETKPDFEFTDHLVVAKPEWEIFEIGENDEFLILACDGLWDVLNTQEAVNIVQRSGRNCKRACEELISEALRLGSSDNITVTVIRLHDK